MFTIALGVDEVGRGCLAGPLVAAAVVLHVPIEGLKDSKLLNRKQRGVLARLIYEYADVGLGWVEPREVDAAGLTLAISKAMRTAVKQIVAQYDEIIIDGNINYLADMPKARPLIRADSSVPSVSAASIIAKVTRDNYMRKAAVKFPIYQFEKHVGYGTKLHLEMLQRHGICELHRQSFQPVRALL